MGVASAQEFKMLSVAQKGSPQWCVVPCVSNEHAQSWTRGSEIQGCLGLFKPQTLFHNVKVKLSRNTLLLRWHTSLPPMSPMSSELSKTTLHFVFLWKTSCVARNSSFAGFSTMCILSFHESLKDQVSLIDSMFLTKALKPEHSTGCSFCGRSLNIPPRHILRSIAQQGYWEYSSLPQITDRQAKDCVTVVQRYLLRLQTNISNISMATFWVILSCFCIDTWKYIKCLQIC